MSLLAEAATMAAIARSNPVSPVRGGARCPTCALEIKQNSVHYSGACYCCVACALNSRQLCKKCLRAGRAKSFNVNYVDSPRVGGKLYFTCRSGCK